MLEGVAAWRHVAVLLARLEDTHGAADRRHDGVRLGLLEVTDPAAFDLRDP